MFAPAAFVHAWPDTFDTIRFPMAAVGTSASFGPDKRFKKCPASRFIRKIVSKLIDVHSVSSSLKVDLGGDINIGV